MEPSQEPLRTVSRRQVPIAGRRVELDFDANEIPRAWYRGDLFTTLVFDTLSLFFPAGERFFVDAVKRFRDRVRDPELRAAVAGFIEQEATHAKAHRALNELQIGRGLESAVRREREARAMLAFARARFSPEAQLAITCALEHFTALLAEQILDVDEHWRSIHPTMRPLWLWHALEEAEHKAVAFDVYRAIGGRYPTRIGMMIIASVFLIGHTSQAHTRFLAELGHSYDLRTWGVGLRALWIRPGYLRRLVPRYLAYYKPGFHPNDYDNHELVERWRERLFGQEGEMISSLQRGRPAAPRVDA